MNARITIDGQPIHSSIQNEKCHGCGMGLCDFREYHPQKACDVFTLTHDSREVWRALWQAIKSADTEIAGAHDLYELFYVSSSPCVPVDAGRNT